MEEQNEEVQSHPGHSYQEIQVNTESVVTQRTQGWRRMGRPIPATHLTHYDTTNGERRKVAKEQKKQRKRESCQERKQKGEEE